jgi:hypothetical protein
MARDGKADMSDIDLAGALAVFSIDPWSLASETPSTLARRFRALASKVHPDKGGSETLFETVCDCHKVVLAEWARVAADTESLDARMSARGFAGGRFEPAGGPAPRPPRPAPAPPSSAGGGDFDAAAFNRSFEDTRAPSRFRDKGYGEWLSSGAGSAPRGDGGPPVVAEQAGGSGFSDAFNREFERKAMPPPESEMAVILHPDAINQGGGQQALGVSVDVDDEEVEDYGFFGDGSAGLSASDCKRAYSLERLVSPAWNTAERTLGAALSERGMNMRR